MSRPAEARLDLAALRHNLEVARSLAPRSKVMAVVKANAYGHGALTIARELAARTDALAVACIEEAVALREGGISAPILLLQGVFTADELPLTAELELWLTITNEQQLGWLEQAALSRAPACWLKIDTGMHRLGVMPAQVEALYRRLRAVAAGEPVLCTHFAAADNLESGQTQMQIARFQQACDQLPGPRSAANSAGVLAWPDAHYDWIRPGYMLYGNSPFVTPQASAASLRPVMTLVSRVTGLRDIEPGESVGYGANWTADRPSRIATVTMGYGDGYPRHAPNGTPVLVNGMRAALAGRVSMDMITVDVTDLPPVALGDEVTLWGQGLSVDEIARYVGTIGYELTTRMPARVPRAVTTA